MAGSAERPPRVAAPSVGGRPRPRPARPRVARQSPFVLHSVADSRWGWVGGGLHGDPETPPRGWGEGDRLLHVGL